MNQIGPARSALAANGPHRGPVGRLRPSDNLVRCLVAHARAAADHRLGGPVAAMEALYPGDAHSLAVVRATANPGTTTSSGWTALINLDVVSDLLINLGPSSAASALIRAGMNLDLTGRGSLIVPGMIANAGAVSFVEESQPIPVHAIDTSGGTTVTGFKLGGIVTLSRELARTTNAEPVIRALMTESVGLALDAAMFSTTAADDSRPAGLLLDAPDVSTGGTIEEDVAALAGSVAPVAGSQLVLVAGPAAYARLRVRLPSSPWPAAYPSAALAANKIVAVAANAIVFAASPRPEVDLSEEAGVVMVDTAPGAVIASDPSRSLFQAGTIGLRLTMGVSWGLRASGAVATATGTGW